MAEEYVYMVALNSAAVPVGVFEVSHGCINSTLLNPRELYLRALLSGAVGIVVLHNHPSGDSVPSDEDLYLTERLVEAGQIIGIHVIDHIIVGEDSYYSFRDNELL